MTYTLESFAVGQRVQLHPALDLWMRGARYGQVTRIFPTSPIPLSVYVDTLARVVRLHPRNICEIL